ncbi:hypothetical protein C8J57DRAFT_280549 [Mycena rebaudengoi]|nr:hypothetical protein C8J57DRAFT_280549 [Mycena rebaudengoi]
MNSTLHQYPQEIIDVIIDALGKDKDALIACSLAAPAFITPTRRHLFHRLSLGDAYRAHDLLTFLPHVASLFRELWVDFSDPTHEVYDPHLIPILDRLNNIEMLTMEDYYSRPDPLEASLLRLISKPSFNHLTLRNTVVSLPFFLAAMSASPTLTMAATDVGHFEESHTAAQLPPVSSPPAVALRTLIILNMGYPSLHNFLLDPNTAPYLRSVTQLHLNELRLDFFVKFLALTAPTLEKLILGCDDGADGPVELPSLPLLRLVEFRISHSAAGRIDDVVRHLRASTPQVEIVVSYRRTATTTTTTIR